MLAPLFPITGLNRRRFVPQPILRDLFTDVDGTSPAAHTMDLGGGWLVHSGTWIIQGNKVRKTASNLTHQVITADAGLANVAISVDLTMAANAAAGLYLRATDGTHGWLLQLFQGFAPSFALYENNGVGSFVQRAAANPSLVAGQTYRVVGSLVGQVITATLDGGSQISYPSASFNASATRFGLHSHGLNMDFDNLLVTRP